jgi:hypothetical protein
MHQMLDIPRAAKMAGVTCDELKRLIIADRLKTIDGKVDYEELLRLYPEIEASRSAMVEITSQIREDSIIKGLMTRAGYKIEDVKTLKAELSQMNCDLAFHQAQEKHYRDILLELRPKLEKLRDHSPDCKNRIQSVVDWLVHNSRELWEKKPHLERHGDGHEK